MNHPRRSIILIILGFVGFVLTLVILSWVGFALISSIVTDLVANARATSPAVLDRQKITLENAKGVSYLARLKEGSFTAQSAWSPDGRCWYRAD